MSTELEVRYQDVAPTFDSLAHQSPSGDYWSARELQAVAGYRAWREWANVLVRARLSLINSTGVSAGQEHFVRSHNMVSIGSGAQREVDDWHLSRLGAYLTVMNGDPHMPEIAAAQLYFSVMTRQAELTQAVPDLSEVLARLDRQDQAIKNITNGVGMLLTHKSRKPPKRLTDSDRYHMVDAIRKGQTPTEVAARFDVSLTTVSANVKWLSTPPLVDTWLGEIIHNQPVYELTQKGDKVWLPVSCQCKIGEPVVASDATGNHYRMTITKLSRDYTRKNNSDLFLAEFADKRLLPNGL